MQSTLHENSRYTYEDYATWDDGNRYELINGVLYVMEPNDTALHRSICEELFRQLASSLLEKPYAVFHSPYDVCLRGRGNNDDTVVQPDLLIVCDLSKLDENRCNGAPDFIVEILSPSTACRDLLVKHNTYLKAGVREYWIIDPDNEVIRVCLLKDGKYEVTDHVKAVTLPVNILKGCDIEIAKVFG